MGGGDTWWWVAAVAVVAAIVGWDYVLEEERTHTRTVTTTDAQGRTSSHQETYWQWHQVDRRAAALASFEVVDDTGSVPVVPGRSKVVPRKLHHDLFRDNGGRGFFASMFDNRTGRYRETERGVAVGDELFVVGDATLDDQPCVPVLREPVLVSTRSESSHTSALGLGVALLVVVAVAASGLASALALAPTDLGRRVAWLPGLGVASVVLGLAWAATTHNRLRLVSESVGRALSLIDVQLQRRGDLVDALIGVVAAHSAHEREAMTRAAAARATAGRGRGAAELASEAGAQRDELRRLLAVVEGAPELSADVSFRRLSSELADAEERIAASRTFYNDSLTLLRDRAASFPGVLVARRIHDDRRELLDGHGFERTVPPESRRFG